MGGFWFEFLRRVSQRGKQEKEDLPIIRQTLRQVIAEYYPKDGKYFIKINAKKVRITTL